MIRRFAERRVVPAPSHRPSRAASSPAAVLPAIADRATFAVALACGAVALVALALSLSRIIEQLTWNADVAAGSVVGGGLGAGGSVVTFQVVYVWFSALTAGLSFHGVVQSAFPPAIWAVTLVILARTTYVLGGRWATAILVVLGIGAAPLIVVTEVSPSFHGLAWCGLAMLGAWVVRLAGPAGITNTRAGVLGWLAIGAVLGLITAQDVALLPDGVVPLVLTGAGLIVVRRRDGWPVARRLLLAAGAVGGWTVAWQGAMHLFGYSAGVPNAALQGVAGPRQWPAHLHALAGTLWDMVNGERVTTQGLPIWRLRLAQILALSAVAALPLAVFRWGRMAPRSSTEPVHVEHGDTRVSGPPMFAYGLFWLCSAGTVMAFFVFTRTVVLGTGPLDALGRLTGVGRYVVPVFLAVIAVVPLLASRRAVWRSVVCAGAALLSLTSANGVTSAATAGVFRPAETTPLPALVTALQVHGLHRGYASYWDAMPLTYKTSGALTVRPARDFTSCVATPRSVGICAGDANVVTGWYRPQSTATFVVVDPGFPGLQTPPGPVLGAPSQVFTVDRFTVFVYPYDVASAMGRR